jgi:hypothetical protein
LPLPPCAVVAEGDERGTLFLVTPAGAVFGLFSGTLASLGAPGLAGAVLATPVFASVEGVPGCVVGLREVTLGAGVGGTFATLEPGFPGTLLATPAFPSAAGAPGRTGFPEGWMAFGGNAAVFPGCWPGFDTVEAVFAPGLSGCPGCNPGFVAVSPGPGFAGCAPGGKPAFPTGRFGAPGWREGFAAPTFEPAPAAGAALATSGGN